MRSFLCLMTLPPAFSHRNFRLFWAGNALSLIGTLAQDAGRGWLVRSLTPDPFTLTAVAACTTLPVLFLTLYAGAVADRINKQYGLIATNVVALFLAVILWGLTFADVIAIWHVAVLSLLVGIVTAFDIPIRQSMNVEMVGRKDLPNAIALNSTAFNGARAVGPAAGGILIHFLGTSGCFLLNALSFVPLIVNLRRMNLPKPEQDKRRASLSDVREGYDFVRAHAILWPLTLMVAVTSVFALSYGNLLPIYARDVLHTDARGFSALLTSAGIGALTSSAKLALLGSTRQPATRLFGGAAALCLSISAFAFAPNLWLACALQFASGYFLLTYLTTANTLVQTIAPDNLRGRVFSLYSLALVGAAPIGAFWVGGVAKLSDPRSAIMIGAGVALVWVIATYIRCRSILADKLMQSG